MRALQKQYVVDRKGQKTAVILSIGAYGELLEYPPDISIITKRLYEPTITFEEIKKGLKEDGLL